MSSLSDFVQKILAIRRGEEYPRETLTPTLVRILSASAIWRDSNHLSSASRTYKLLLIINHLNFTFFIFTMVFNLVTFNDSWPEFADCFCQVFAITGAYVKAEIVQWKRQALTEIFAKVAEKDEILQENAKSDSQINVLRGQFYWKELSLVTLFVFFDGCAVIMACGYIMLTPSNMMPFPAAFPFDIEDGGLGYWLAYFSQIWGTVFLSINYLLMDASIGSCYNQISLQFQVIGRAMENLQAEKDQDKRKKRLGGIIQEHDQLFRLVSSCNYSLSSFFTVVVALSLSSITFITFELSAMHDVLWMVFIKYVMFWALMISTFLFWCYLGQKLEDSSFNVAESIYNSGWREEDNHTRRCVLLMLIRAQSPARLRIVPLFEFNFEAFAKVLKMSLSYFMVLRDLTAN